MARRCIYRFSMVCMLLLAASAASAAEDDLTLVNDTALVGKSTGLHTAGFEQLLKLVPDTALGFEVVRARPPWTPSSKPLANPAC